MPLSCVRFLSRSYAVGIFDVTILFDIKSLWIIGIPIPCPSLVVFVGLFPSLGVGFVVPCALPALW